MDPSLEQQKIKTTDLLRVEESSMSGARSSRNTKKIIVCELLLSFSCVCLFVPHWMDEAEGGPVQLPSLNSCDKEK